MMRSTLLPALAIIGAIADIPAFADQGYFDKAMENRARGQWSAALIEARNAVREDPANIDARLLLAEAYLIKGRPEQAHKEYLQVLQDHGNDPKVVLALGRAYLDAGKAETLLKLLDAGLPTSRTGNPAASVVRARAYAAMNDVHAAQTTLHQAINQAPGNADILFALARLSLQRKDLPATRQYLSSARQLSPEHPEGILLDAQLQYFRKHYDTAADRYTKAASTLPNPIPAWIGLAWTRLAQGRLDAVVDATDKVLKTAPRQPVANYLRAAARYQQGEYQKAVPLLLGVLNLIPTDGPALLLLGATYFKLQQYDQTQTYLERFIAANPGYLPAQGLLAEARLARNKPVQALESLQQTPGIDGDGMLLLLGAKAAMKSERYTEAGRWLDRVLEAGDTQANQIAEQAIAALQHGEVRQVGAILETGIPHSAIIPPGAATERDMQRSALRRVIEEALQGQRYQEVITRAETELLPLMPSDPLPYNLIGTAQFALGDRQAARDSFSKALRIAPDNIPARYNIANIDLAEGHVDAAGKGYDRILAQQPDFLPGLRARADIALMENDPVSAIDWLQRARNAHADDLETRLTLADLLLRQRRLDDSLEVAQEAYALAPANQRVLLFIALLRQLRNEHEEALGYLDQLVSQAPKSIKARYRRAISNTQLGRSERAKDDLTTILEQDPTHLEAAKLLATLYKRDARWTAVAEIAKRLQQQFPERADGWSLQGDALIAQGQTAEAISAYNTAVGLQANQKTVMDLFFALRKDGQEQPAAQLMKEWLSKHPKDIGPRLALAEALMNSDDGGSALRHYRLVLETQPDNPIALNNVALLLSASQDWKPARDAAEKAYRLLPDHAAVQDTLGWILVNQGEIQRGLTLLTSAAESMPDDPSIQYHLAVALTKAGDREAARARLRTLLGSPSPFAQRQSAEALLQDLKP